MNRFLGFVVGCIALFGLHAYSCARVYLSHTAVAKRRSGSRGRRLCGEGGGY